MNKTSSNWTIGKQETVTGVLRKAVDARPQHTFIEFPDGKMTYAEFDRRSNALAHGLKDMGIDPGETVTSMLDNNIDCVLLWFAVNKIGAVWVPINTALKGEFLRHQVSDSDARLVIAESEYIERFFTLENSLPKLEKLYYRDTPPENSFKRIIGGALTDLISGNEAAIEDTNAPGDLSMLIYTSGTTGPSKGCMISHNYAASMARLSQSAADRGPDDINWSCLPLFHFNATTATVLATAMTHASCYFVQRFSLSGFWDSVEKSEASIVNVIGQMVPLIAKAPDSEASQRCFGQVQAVMALPFDEELQNIWKERFGVKIAGANCYGLTEASLITSLRHDEYAKPGSSGRRNELFDVMVVNDNFEELPSGVAGEVVCRPRQPHIMFEGYWKNPEKTAEAWRHMWMHSGDIGMFDDDGFFYFVDRKKDYLRRGGENISSFELEMTFLQHPDIKEVAIHSVYSELSEDEVKATIVLGEGCDVSEETLCRWSVDQLPYFAVPRYIEFRDSLPINPLNKVMKYELRDEGVTPATWDRATSDIQLVKR